MLWFTFKVMPTNEKNPDDYNYMKEKYKDSEQ